MSREEFFRKQQAAIEERRARSERRAAGTMLDNEDGIADYDDDEGEEEVERVEDHLTYSEAAMMEEQEDVEVSEVTESIDDGFHVDDTKEADPWDVAITDDPAFSPTKPAEQFTPSPPSYEAPSDSSKVEASPVSPKPNDDGTFADSSSPRVHSGVSSPQDESEGGITEMISLFDGILSRLRTDSSCLKDFGSEDFLDRILSIMEANVYDLEISSKGLEIIQCMCRFNDDVRNENTANVSMLGKLGACHVVINCIKVHGADNAELAAIGMSTIRNLASSNAGNIKMFGDLGACLLAQQMLATHGFTNPATGKASLGGIANLCFLNPNNRSALGKAGACTTIVDVIKAHGTSDVNFAKLGLAAIINLAGTSTNKSLFCEAAACETVLDLISHFSTSANSNNDVPLHGSWAMLSLIDNSQDNLNAFRRLNAADLLTKNVIHNPNISNKGAKSKAQEVVDKLL